MSTAAAKRLWKSGLPKAIMSSLLQMDSPSGIEERFLRLMERSFVESREEKEAFALLQRETDFWLALSLDSLDVIDFSMRLESEFKLKIPEADLEDLRTI